MKRNAILLYAVGVVIGVGAIALILKKILVKFTAVKIATNEWKGWGEPTIQKDGKQTKKGGFEADKGFSERVSEYWRIGTGSKLTGQDRNVPWSSAFISYIMKKAGAGDKFVYNPSHSKYITDSISNRKQGKFNEAFVGYKINEVSPEVGDLVCYSRQDGVGYDTTGNYKSHCDLVVKKSKNQIEVIGGNVNDSVTKKIVSTNNQGIVSDKKYNWFTVIKTNI
jgi:hypothetical protein